MSGNSVQLMKRFGVLLVAAVLAPGAVMAQGTFEQGLDAYIAGDYQQAYQVWKPLAQEGDVVAAFNVGVLYAQGRGVTVNMQEALRWYRRAAEAGYAPAQFNLGTAFREGTGVDVDKQQAMQWWTRAADQGHSQSMFNLATLYWRGDGVDQDQDRALQLYRRAAEQGDERARKLVDKLSPATASTQPSPPPADATAQAATTGPDVRPKVVAPQDPRPTGVETTREVAADAEQPEADKAVATAPPPPVDPGARTEAWILAQDPKHLTIQLAAHSDEPSRSKFVAEYGFKPNQVAYFKVRQKGRDWYKLVYGVFSDMDEAKTAREGLPEALKKQVPWIRPFAALQAEIERLAPAAGASAAPPASMPDSSPRSAPGDAGPPDVQAKLRDGQVAFNAQDYGKAWRIWQPLAIQGLAQAQYNLGFMYESGWGVDRDDRQAAEWYQFAANQGHPKAQFNLGLLYLDGRGVGKNESLGWYWIQNAADQNDVRAVEYINRSKGSE